MRKLLLLPLTLLLCAQTTTPAPLSGKLGTPIQLFTGTLDGWTWVPTLPTNGAPPLKLEDVWSVKDGVLHVNGKAQTKNFAPGYLRQRKSFTNYVLTVEQRHLSKGNGGILIGITGPDTVWPRTLQVQGQFGDVGDFINQGDFKMTVPPDRTTKRKTDILTRK